jgi:hypothetical protein
MNLKAQSSDAHSFIAVYYYKFSVLSVIIFNPLLCLSYLNFVIAMYVYKTPRYIGFSTTCGFRMGKLESMPGK